MNALLTKLKDFKLAGMASSLNTRLTYANKNSLSHIQFLELLCDDEENNRRENSYKKRYSTAKLPSHKTIDDFDFSFQPSINQQKINDLETCHYIDEKRNVIFIGNPGTGKTHLSVALGIKALSKNYKVLFSSVSEMLYQLHMSKADNSYHKKLKEYLSPDLLILDELGFKKVPSYSADDLFEVITKRYEHGSCIVTTNKGFDQWGDIVGDQTLSSALVDRLVHHSDLIEINGHSYRSKNVNNNQTTKEEICKKNT